MKKVISTKDAPGAVGPYSQAIRAGSMVFCAGQIPLHPNSGQIESQDVGEQAKRVLENIGAVLKAANLSFADVVKTTVFLADMNDFAAMNEVYGKYFAEPYPARATVQVARLPKDARVEIDLIASFQ
jgi:2-iminobutanoate/2-iminopropanoate deaminase